MMSNVIPIKTCKKYLEEKGYKFVKYDRSINFYYFKSPNDFLVSFSTKHLRRRVDRMQMDDWFQNMFELERRGIQLELNINY